MAKPLRTVAALALILAAASIAVVMAALPRGASLPMQQVRSLSEVDAARIKNENVVVLYTAPAWAPWCPACRALRNATDAVRKALPADVAKFVWVDCGAEMPGTIDGACAEAAITSDFTTSPATTMQQGVFTHGLPQLHLYRAVPQADGAVEEPARVFDLKEVDSGSVHDFLRKHVPAIRAHKLPVKSYTQRVPYDRVAPSLRRAEAAELLPSAFPSTFEKSLKAMAMPSNAAVVEGVPVASLVLLYTPQCVLCKKAMAIAEFLSRSGISTRRVQFDSRVPASWVGPSGDIPQFVFVAESRAVRFTGTVTTANVLAFFMNLMRGAVPAVDVRRQAPPSSVHVLRAAKESYTSALVANVEATGVLSTAIDKEEHAADVVQFLSAPKQARTAAARKGKKGKKAAAVPQVQRHYMEILREKCEFINSTEQLATILDPPAGATSTAILVAAQWSSTTAELKSAMTMFANTVGFAAGQKSKNSVFPAVKCAVLPLFPGAVPVDLLLNPSTAVGSFPAAGAASTYVVTVDPPSATDNDAVAKVAAVDTLMSPTPLVRWLHSVKAAQAEAEAIRTGKKDAAGPTFDNFAASFFAGHSGSANAAALQATSMIDGVVHLNRAAAPLLQASSLCPSSDPPIRRDAETADDVDGDDDEAFLSEEEEAERARHAPSKGSSDKKSGKGDDDGCDGARFVASSVLQQQEYEQVTRAVVLVYFSHHAIAARSALHAFSAMAAEFAHTQAVANDEAEAAARKYGTSLEVERAKDRAQRARGERVHRDRFGSTHGRSGMDLSYIDNVTFFAIDGSQVNLSPGSAAYPARYGSGRPYLVDVEAEYARGGSTDDDDDDDVSNETPVGFTQRDLALIDTVAAAKAEALQSESKMTDDASSVDIDGASKAKKMTTSKADAAGRRAKLPRTLDIPLHAVGLLDTLLQSINFSPRPDRGITQLTANTFAATAHDPTLGVLVLFYRKGEENSQYVIPALTAASKAFSTDKHRVVIAMMDCHAVPPEMLGELGVTYWPQLRWYGKGAMQSEEERLGDLFESTPFKESIIEYISEEMEFAHMELTHMQDKNKQTPFRALLGKEINEVIIGSLTENVVVFFYDGRRDQRKKVEVLGRVAAHFINYSSVVRGEGPAGSNGDGGLFGNVRPDSDVEGEELHRDNEAKMAKGDALRAELEKEEAARSDSDDDDSGVDENLKPRVPSGLEGLRDAMNAPSNDRAGNARDIPDPFNVSFYRVDARRYKKALRRAGIKLPAPRAGDTALSVLPTLAFFPRGTKQGTRAKWRTAATPSKTSDNAKFSEAAIASWVAEHLQQVEGADLPTDHARVVEANVAASSKKSAGSKSTSKTAAELAAEYKRVSSVVLSPAHHKVHPFVASSFYFTTGEVNAHIDPALSSAVEDLDQSSFFEFLRDTEKTDAVVLFYASWCQHSQEYAPEFAKAAEQLQGSVRFGKLDVPSNAEAGHHQGIQAFPTVKVYFAGSPLKADLRGEQFRGAQTADALVEFVTRIRGTSRVQELHRMREERLAIVPDLATNAEFEELVNGPHRVEVTAGSIVSPTSAAFTSSGLDKALIAPASMSTRTGALPAKALQRLRDTAQHVLVEFQADWCGHCPVVQQLLADTVEFYGADRIAVRTMSNEEFSNISAKHAKGGGLPIIVLFKREVTKATAPKEKSLSTDDVDIPSALQRRIFGDAAGTDGAEKALEVEEYQVITTAFTYTQARMFETLTEFIEASIPELKQPTGARDRFDKRRIAHDTARMKQIMGVTELSGSKGSTGLEDRDDDDLTDFERETKTEADLSRKIADGAASVDGASAFDRRREVKAAQKRAAERKKAAAKKAKKAKAKKQRKAKVVRAGADDPVLKVVQSAKTKKKDDEKRKKKGKGQRPQNMKTDDPEVLERMKEELFGANPEKAKKRNDRIVFADDDESDGSHKSPSVVATEEQEEQNRRLKEQLEERRRRQQLGQTDDDDDDTTFDSSTGSSGSSDPIVSVQEGMEAPKFIKEVQLWDRDAFQQSVGTADVVLVLHYSVPHGIPAMHAFNDAAQTMLGAIRHGLFRLAVMEASEFSHNHPLLGAAPALTLFRGFAHPGHVRFQAVDGAPSPMDIQSGEVTEEQKMRHEEAERIAETGAGGSLANVEHVLKFVQMNLADAGLGSVELDTKGFPRAIANRTATIAVFLYAPWCEPCRDLATKYDEVAQMLGHIEHIVLTRVDISKTPKPYKRLGKPKLPALFVYDRDMDAVKAAGDEGTAVSVDGASDDAKPKTDRMDREAFLREDTLVDEHQAGPRRTPRRMGTMTSSREAMRDFIMKQDDDAEKTSVDATNATSSSSPDIDDVEVEVVPSPSVRDDGIDAVFDPTKKDKADDKRRAEEQAKAQKDAGHVPQLDNDKEYHPVYVPSEYHLNVTLTDFAAPGVLVLLTAKKWCAHCHLYEATLRAAVPRLSRRCVIAQMDLSDAPSRIGRRFRAPHVPALVFVRKWKGAEDVKKFVSRSSGRHSSWSVDAVVEFATRHAMPFSASVALPTYDDFDPAHLKPQGTASSSTGAGGKTGGDDAPSSGPLSGESIPRLPVAAAVPVFLSATQAGAAADTAMSRAIHQPTRTAAVVLISSSSVCAAKVCAVLPQTAARVDGALQGRAAVALYEAVSDDDHSVMAKRLKIRAFPAAVVVCRAAGEKDDLDIEVIAPSVLRPKGRKTTVVDSAGAIAAVVERKCFSGATTKTSKSAKKAAVKQEKKNPLADLKFEVPATEKKTADADAAPSGDAGQAAKEPSLTATIPTEADLVKIAAAQAKADLTSARKTSEQVASQISGGSKKSDDEFDDDDEETEEEKREVKAIKDLVRRHTEESMVVFVRTHSDCRSHPLCKKLEKSFTLAAESTKKRKDGLYVDFKAVDAALPDSREMRLLMHQQKVRAPVVLYIPKAADKVDGVQQLVEQMKVFQGRDKSSKALIEFVNEEHRAEYT